MRTLRYFSKSHWARLRRGGLLLALLAGAPVVAQAQQVLVQANVADDTVKTTFGPNRRWFGHGYVALGLVAGPAEAGARLRDGLTSLEARVGGRLKLRLSQSVALCGDLAYAFLRYDLAQEAGKLVPAPTLHQRESLALHQVVSEVALRLNFGRRGNAVGSYLDLLAGGSWAAATRHRTEDVPAPGIGSVETTESGLPYLRRFGGSAGARLGFDRYALAARYRFSPAFASSYAAWPELPRWVIGVEVGLF
ncbi:hypothetical protein MON38_08300 [Hymenobacter sp. DH14]|uniref:Outer membrane protein beta-barrel domain-containing protein n=1 Tax=Hymenobacter cyanobacteriorum TaxID=2926463 RepID=A0A9X2AI81_9BACT|nr:hypothetical protein [Hymenobacter cyanobacteriorum]MCI1187419.1 hypothetical protein [Hymenobacter cyanobacteriorum]